MLPDSDLQIFLTHHHVRLQESVHEDDTITNFKPSLMVATAFLATVFLLTVLVILYFKFCHGNASSSSITSGDQQEVFAPDDNVSLPSGLDRKEIQSLPFFRFGVLRGSREGLECSVCLSTYEDTEILRLLPKCRHAFHVDCVDRWLSQHDTCPLCRSQVVVNDAESNSEDAEGSISNANRSSSGSIANNEGVDLFVEREEEELGDQDSAIWRSSSIFSIGSSFRRLFGGEGRVPSRIGRARAGDRALHKHNHKVIFSDMVFKNRWSNVSSSDLIFLNSEMLLCSDRLSSRDLSAAREAAAAVPEAETFQSIEQLELNHKKPISMELGKRDSNVSSSSPSRAVLNSAGGGDSSLVAGRRSVSEITLYSRVKELGWLSYKVGENPATSAAGGRVEEEETMKRRIWFPIARKTVEWFANSRREETVIKTNHYHHGLDVV